MAKLIAYVHVTADGYTSRWLEPGDEVPEWALPELRENPLLWDGDPYDDADEVSEAITKWLTAEEEYLDDVAKWLDAEEVHKTELEAQAKADEEPAHIHPVTEIKPAPAKKAAPRKAAPKKAAPKPGE